jgi:DNA helicase II / ATP-dependent DNA helicase PcrA
MLSSFTRGAATELADRNIPINRDMVGTLHSFAYRALGMPKITESMIKEWNAQWREVRPKYVLSESLAQNSEPESGGATDGDRLLNMIEVYRAKMWDQILWVPEAREFWKHWCDFKSETDSMDFTDLIETCLHDVPRAPGNPSVGMFDESQDLTLLEVSLIRKWGKNMGFFFIVGDPDQAIFTWKGADPNIFLDPPTPPDRTRVLSQSHRVPRNIHGIAQMWIRRLENRYPSLYYPRDYEGQIYAPSAVTFKDAPRLIAHAERWIDEGKEIMFLGACGYHLYPVVAELRKQGIPFHNPNRRRNGSWNPLWARKGVTTADRIKAFMAGGKGQGWTGQELRYWTHMLGVKDTLARGAKKKMEELDDEIVFKEDRLTQWFEPTALRAAMARDIYWLRQHIAGQYESSASFALNIVDRRGVKALNDTPNVIVGTVHSVKGDEASVVYLDPSLSWAGIQQWNAGERDAIIRQMYVAMTRAKETLVVCRGEKDRSVNLPTVPPDTKEEEF